MLSNAAAAHPRPPAVTSAEISVCENVHRLIEVVLGEPVGEVIGFEEAATLLGTTVNVVRWYTTNKNADRPIPSKLLVIADRKRPIRYFLRSEVEQWKTAPKLKAQKMAWPPSRRVLSSSANGKMPVPKEKHFPDNGEDIPGYKGLSGRFIQPAWRTCRRCGKRFISPDRRNVHSHDNCYQATE